MGKRELKVYFSLQDDLSIQDTTFCCNMMRRCFYHFDFDMFDSAKEKEELRLLMHGEKDEYIPISYCPFCGAKIKIKPSRLE